MLWIKRNLFLVVSGVIAAVLMAGSLFYLYQGLEKNSAVDEEYETKKMELDGLYRKSPFPAKTNIVIAREEVEKMNTSVEDARKFFQPFDVPAVSGLAFKTLLDNTIFDLTRLSLASSVTLPGDDYEFSFAAQKEKLQLNPQSFPGIVEQLTEVQAICSILFDARIHALTSFKRVRLTSDDPVGTKDYSDELKFRTNIVTSTVLSPYEVSFTGFSSELAAVLDGFTGSSHGFLIEAIKIERFDEKVDLAPGTRPRPISAPVAPKPKTATENETVLNEERFLTTLLVTVVKLVKPTQ